MNYQVFILRRAQKQLAKFPADAYQDIRAHIYELASNPRPAGCKKLAARNGWRIRIGDYRVVYEINDQERHITILDIDHRKDIYR